MIMDAENLLLGMMIMGLAWLVVLTVATIALLNMHFRLRRLETAPGVQELLSLRNIGKNGKHP